MSSIQQVGVFLVDVLFGMFILAVVLRFLLAYVRADFHNPISQAIVKITNPVLKPLRRVIPSLGKLDTSSVVLALGLTFIQLNLMAMIQGLSFNPLVMIVASVMDLLKLIIWIYIIALIVQAIMSWFGNTYGNPMVSILHSLTRPILSPIQKVMPDLGGIDLSPMVAIILLNVLLILLG